MSAAEESLSGVEAALVQMTGNDRGLVAAAMLYASAYEENPAAVIGMLCVTQGIILQRVSETHAAFMEIHSRVKPVIDDPSIILASVPEPLRAMLGL